MPASISQSGNRERIYLTTRDLVKAEARRLSEKYKKRGEKHGEKHGENASVISPGVADEATKALEILSGFPGLTLCESARFYKNHHDIRSKAPSRRVPSGYASPARAVGVPDS